MTGLSASAKVFAWLSIGQVALHFGSSTVYALNDAVRPVFFIDYVSVALLLLGALGLLRWHWGPGPLCGGWGFELCLYSRAVFQRVGSLQDEAATHPSQLQFELYFLGSWLLLAAAAFAFSVVLCIREARNRTPMRRSAEGRRH